MKQMGTIEFSIFLNTLAVKSCESEDSYNYFKNINFNSMSWPNCTGKEVLKVFNQVMKEKGFWPAFYKVKEQFSFFEDIELSDLPESTTEIQTILDHNLRIVLAKDLSKKLSENPDKANLYIDQFSKSLSLSDITEYTIKDFILPTVEKNIQEAKEGKSRIIIPDFKLFSEEIGGFNGSRVSGISASSGFGKTKLAINLVDSARKVMPVYYFNMEMSPEDFTAQFIQKAANITYSDFKNASYQNFEDKQNKIIEYKKSFEKTYDITFTDGRSLNIDTICNKIITKMQNGGLVVCDYDQKLLSNERDDEWFRVLKSVEKLEQAAKQSGCHILILFQADDEGQAKSSKRSIQPLSAMTHFTKDSDNVYYLKNLKNRFGKTGFEIVLNYRPETSTITEGTIKPFTAPKQFVNPIKRF